VVLQIQAFKVEYHKNVITPQTHVGQHVTDCA